MKGVAHSAAAVAALASRISDRTLIEFIADGDKAALELLYLRHSARVYRFVVHLTGSGSAAEETVLEVFLAVWRDARRFKGKSQVRTWLLKIARFKALSHRRRRSEVPLDRHAQDLIEDASDGPAALNEKRRSRDILQKCMTTLTPIHREVINLIPCQGKKGRGGGSNHRNAGLYHRDALALCQRPHGHAARHSGHRSRVGGALASATPQKRFRNHRIQNRNE
jgi:RNA polymerase sigma-70 factor, ECF subfamily